MRPFSTTQECALDQDQNQKQSFLASQDCPCSAAAKNGAIGN